MRIRFGVSLLLALLLAGLLMGAPALALGDDASDAKRPAGTPSPSSLAAPNPAPIDPGAVLTGSPPTNAAPPIYQRWWFWAGSSLLVATGIVAVVALSTSVRTWNNIPDVHGTIR